MPAAPQWSDVHHPVGGRSFEAGDVVGAATGSDLVSTCLARGLAGCAEGRPGCCPVDTQVAPNAERWAERGGQRRDCLRSSRGAVARACHLSETAGGCARALGNGGWALPRTAVHALRLSRKVQRSGGAPVVCGCRSKGVRAWRRAGGRQRCVSRQLLRRHPKGLAWRPMASPVDWDWAGRARSHGRAATITPKGGCGVEAVDEAA